MHSRNRLAPCIFLAALLLAAPVRAQMAAFIKIIDGDSLLVEAGGRSMEVRLIGVDAPEFKQEYGREAKEFSLRFCHGHRLRLELDRDKLDRYGRVLAYVHRDGKMLNEELLKAGLAVAVKVKPNTRHYSRLKAAEHLAEDRKHGFWKQGGLKMPPAQWRKAHPRKREK
ncbi:MAG: thermonuclease family protein [Desulfovibrionaceae bacterium]|nr:thermonuclease family protein [Desulfovibrionaceae bacterium]